MLEAFKSVFNDKPDVHSVPPAPLLIESPRLLAQGPQAKTTFRVGVPNEPISDWYLGELTRVFDELQMVKRACYVLLEANQKFSYLVCLDLDVKPGQEPTALQLISASLYPYNEPPFKGRWPIDLGRWDEQMVRMILDQSPELHFYNRN